MWSADGRWNGPTKFVLTLYIGVTHSEVSFAHLRPGNSLVALYILSNVIKIRSGDCRFTSTKYLPGQTVARARDYFG
jgi:hypothetical protein